MGTSSDGASARALSAARAVLAGLSLPEGLGARNREGGEAKLGAACEASPTGAVEASTIFGMTTRRI
eukprot:10687665-Alexandrium_andersonii.AAC.1